MLAAICALSGIVVLALPIGIIGGNFAEVYEAYKFQKKMGEKMHLDRLDVEAMTVLFNHIDADGSNSVDIFELKSAFENHGMKIDGPKMLHYFSKADKTGGGKLSLSEFIHMCKLIQVTALLCLLFDSTRLEFLVMSTFRLDLLYCCVILWMI